MKKLAIIILSVTIIPFINSCSDFEELNVSPNDVSDVDPSFLLTTNTRNLAYTYSEFGYWGSRIPSLLQYYQVGDGYKSEELNALYWVPGTSSPWESIYARLVNVQAMSDLSKEEENVFIEAAALVYRAVLIDLASKVYGDVPFSETNKLDEGIVFPKYDQQKEIYETLLIDLKTAKTMIEGLDAELPVLDGYDLLYNGDKSKWIKFINSLRIRMCLLLNNKKGEMNVDVDAEFQDAVQNVFTSNDDNAVLNYLGNSESTSFRGGPFVASELTYARRMGLTFLNSLRDQNDPRMYRWLRPVERKWDNDVATETMIEYTDPLGQTFDVELLPYPAGYVDLDTNLYVGLPIGNRASWTSYNAGPYATSVEPKTTPFNSRLSDIYFQNANEYVGMNIITYSEVEFILAEVASIGAFGVTDAESHYRDAIEASMNEWGVFDDYVGGFDFDDFYNHASVDLTQAANEHERIMTQKYISMFFRAEPWFDWRRTGYPDFVVPADADQPAIPIRYHYDTPNPPDPQYVEKYSVAVDRLEKTDFVQVPSKDDTRSRMWLLQGTNLPY